MYIVSGSSPLATPDELSMRYPLSPSNTAAYTTCPPAVVRPAVALTGLSGVRLAPPGGAGFRWFFWGLWS